MEPGPKAGLWQAHVWCVTETDIQLRPLLQVQVLPGSHSNAPNRQLLFPCSNVTIASHLKAPFPHSVTYSHFYQEWKCLGSNATL